MITVVIETFARCQLDQNYFDRFENKYEPVMESRDLVSVSRRVSRPVFWSLGLGVEGLRSRLDLGLEGFRSRSRALRLETLHRLFFTKFCKEFL